MRKYILFFILSIICLAWASDGYCVATKMYGRTALTGGTKSVDNITTMVDGDLCFAVVSSTLYIYVYDDDDATAEGARITGIDPIEPNSGTGAWSLITSFAFGAGTDSAINFRESTLGQDVIAAKIYEDPTDATGSQEDVDLIFQVMVNGSLTTRLKIDADGNVEITGQLLQETFTLLDSATGDDPLVWKFKRAATLVSLDCVTLGGGDIDVDIQECDANGANCATSGATLTDVTTTNQNDVSFTDAAFDAGDWIKMVLTNQAGTTDQLSCTIQWTEAY